MLNFFQETVVGVVAASATSAGTAVTSSVVDLAEYDGVAFITNLATTNAGNSVKIQGGNASDGSDAADIAGSSFVPTVDGGAVVLTVERPRFRYYRAVITRSGANTVTGAIYAIRYRTKGAPIANTNGKQLVGTAAGTA